MKMNEAKRRILIAEENCAVRETLADVLKTADFDVIQARSGAQAVGLLNNPDPIDLLIADLRMSGLDGVEIAHHARGKYPEVPVLFMCTRLDLALVENVPDRHLYLRKPFRLRQLLRAVGSLLSRH